MSGWRAWGLAKGGRKPILCGGASGCEVTGECCEANHPPGGYRLQRDKTLARPRVKLRALLTQAVLNLAPGTARAGLRAATHCLFRGLHCQESNRFGSKRTHVGLVPVLAVVAQGLAQAKRTIGVADGACWLALGFDPLLVVPDFLADATLYSHEVNLLVN